MTCIVGYIDRERRKVVMGADSAGVAGYDITIRKDEKLFKVGDFLIGGTTSYRMLQLLRYKLKIPKIKDKEIFEYMCTDFIDAVRSCLKEGGYIKKATDGDEEGGIFLVGYKDRLFKIDSDFHVGESIEVFNAVGCGDEYAKGSMYNNVNRCDDTECPPVDIVTQALECAEHFSTGVAGPFIINSTP